MPLNLLTQNHFYVDLRQTHQFGGNMNKKNCFLPDSQVPILRDNVPDEQIRVRSPDSVYPELQDTVTEDPCFTIVEDR